MSAKKTGREGIGIETRPGIEITVECTRILDFFIRLMSPHRGSEAHFLNANRRVYRSETMSNFVTLYYKKNNKLRSTSCTRNQWQNTHTEIFHRDFILGIHQKKKFLFFLYVKCD